MLVELFCLNSWASEHFILGGEVPQFNSFEMGPAAASIVSSCAFTC
uniref:Uncharacterized protein n=1 Tax=Arundo donax TaxID=35708 RepID=A0A0A8ZJE9_ARUDO